LKVKLKETSNHRMKHYEKTKGELEILPNGYFFYTTGDRNLTSSTIQEREEVSDFLIFYTLNSVYTFKKL